MTIKELIRKTEVQIDTIEVVLKAEKEANEIDKMKSVLRFLKGFKVDLEEIKDKRNEI